MVNAVTSFAYCTLIGVGYVLVLYLIPKSIRALGRENFTNMKYRMTSVSLITISYLVVMFFHSEHVRQYFRCT